MNRHRPIAARLRESGSSYIVALFVLVVLTILGLSLSLVTETESQIGDNERGICARMTKALGDGGINLRGISGAVLGTQFIMYIAMDTSEDTDKAQQILKALA